MQHIWDNYKQVIVALAIVLAVLLSSIVIVPETQQAVTDWAEVATRKTTGAKTSG